MAEHSIDVNNLNITYKSRQSYSIKKSLLHLKKSDTKVVHAVKDVSFYAEKGEVLGIIGRNGSGKSTLLSAIAGVFSADSGTVDLHGNSVTLMNLGSGFNREVTGRENIYLNGMLLGFDEKYIREREADIIKFAEIGDFIDMPVRTYSSGMSSKLSFSISAFLETDIMLVDEVLSVGDTKFRKKSYAKMRELIEHKDRTALIVSHQENTLRELCDRLLWIHDGELKMVGPANAVLDEYLK